MWSSAGYKDFTVAGLEPTVHLTSSLGPWRRLLPVASTAPRCHRPARSLTLTGKTAGETVRTLAEDKLLFCFSVTSPWTVGQFIVTQRRTLEAAAKKRPTWRQRTPSALRQQRPACVRSWLVVILATTGCYLVWRRPAIAET